MQKVSVIICLSRQPDRTECLVSLGKLGLQRGKDFLICEWPEMVDELLLKGMHQLLVVDLINGSKQAADFLVRRTKGINPRLEAIWFTNHGDRHLPYNGFVVRREGENPLRDLTFEVRDFILRRDKNIVLPKDFSLLFQTAF